MVNKYYLNKRKLPIPLANMISDKLSDNSLAYTGCYPRECIMSELAKPKSDYMTPASLAVYLAAGNHNENIICCKRKLSKLQVYTLRLSNLLL